MAHIVVVGAGQAGAALVAKLRALGCTDQITLIGAEPVPPYQRPPLSKAYLLGELTRERLFLRPENFYADHDITLRLNTQVTGIDATARAVQMGEEQLHYDHLVLTTGASPRQLPDAMGGNLDGVFEVRDLADIDRLAPAVQPGARVVIVGGGYIGLEAAAVARQRGLDVTLIEMAPRILQRVAAPETSDYFRALHQSHGVEVLENAALSTLIGEGHVTGARLQDGRELPADLVIVGVGVTPNTDLAEAAGATLDNGIATDAMGQTSVPGIWAAGDCASLPYGDGRIRLESVPNAIDQAEAVAANIMGANTPYTPRPWFWSDQYDVKLQIAGLNAGYNEVVARHEADGGGVSYWYYRDSTLCAVDAMNAPRAYMVGKRLIEGGRSPAPQAVADPETDLRALMKAE